MSLSRRRRRDHLVRKRPARKEALEQVEARLAALHAETQADSALAIRCVEAAMLRAATERLDRIKAAMARLPEVEARGKKAKRTNARSSTTDPEPTAMKMADAALGQPTTSSLPPTPKRYRNPDHRRVEVVTVGSEVGQMTPMSDQIIEGLGVKPSEDLLDGGFASHDEVDAMSDPKRDVVVYMPLPKLKHAEKGRTRCLRG